MIWKRNQRDTQTRDENQGSQDDHDCQDMKVFPEQALFTQYRLRINYD